MSKKHLAKISIAVFVIFSFVTAKSEACTTFLISSGNELVFGRNYDWMIGYGMVFTNNKGIRKTALTSDRNPAVWTSVYGSVTFNQFGKEFPTGGMNEAGLVVELMWLEGTQYPAADNRPAVGGILQWIQYQLDNHATVEEVIASDSKIRIPSSAVPVHFLVADRNGNCASVEFLNGKLVHHSGNNMKFRVLANDTYQSSQAYTTENIDNDFLQDKNYERSSLNRFAKACDMISHYKESASGNAVGFSFEILDEVAQGQSTQWSIVYDIRNLIIHFKTFNSPSVKTIDMLSIDFECNSTPKMIDIDYSEGVTINPYMKDYDTSSNRALIELSYDGVDFLKDIPPERRDRTAEYPKQLSCIED